MSSTPTWKPREEKSVRLVLNIILWFVGIAIAIAFINHFVPTFDNAVDVLTSLVEDTTHLLVSGAILVALIVLFMEVFGKNGKIHGLISQYYSSLTTRLTYELLNVDPISPLTDKRAEMVAQQAAFEKAFAALDGTIEHFKQQRDEFSTRAEDAEKQAKEAKRRLDDAVQKGQDTTRWREAFDTSSYEYDSGNRTAKDFDKDITRLVPVRDQIKGLQSATNVIIKRLDTDMTSLRARWEAQKSITKVENAARGILSGTSKEALAQEAANLIDERYSESIGKLNNLAEKAQPLLDSIDLSTGRVSSELLDKWALEATPDVRSITDETKVAVPVVPITAVKPGFASTLLK
jgi:phage shock protein A